MSIVIPGKGLAAAALAATTLVAGIGGNHSTGGAPSATDAKVVCHRLLQGAPAQLRQDLAAARKHPKGPERHAAVKKVRTDALAGDYGTKVQAVVEHRKEQRKHARRQLVKQAPQRLRQDLKAARHQPVNQRRAAVRKVWKSALRGTYGDTVQKRLETRRQHRQAHREQCRAQRAARPAQQS